MQKCQPRGSVTWTWISVMASNGVVKVACVAGAERGEIIRERGRSERNGEEGSHADLPARFYNYVECKLRNTNFEYLTDMNCVQSERSIGH